MSLTPAEDEWRRLAADPVANQLAIIASSLTPSQLEALRSMSTTNGRVTSAAIAGKTTAFDLIETFKELQLIKPTVPSCDFLVELLKSKAVKRADLARDLEKAGRYTYAELQI